MGYCMEQRGADFFIAKENFQNVVQAIKDMLKDVWEKGDGCSWKDGKQISANYSWVRNEEIENANNIEQIFNAWRWQIEFDPNENINNIYFEGGKLGQDDLLFETIAPWVGEYSYIEMQGEDGFLWRWVFENGKMEEKEAKISWE